MAIRAALDARHRAGLRELAGRPRYGMRKSAKAAYRNGLQPLRDRTALDLDAGTLKVAATIGPIGWPTS